MEHRLKERLTGAAILVALVVMLVPEMFHGQRADDAATASSSGEEPPVRSYTIDLSNNPTRSGPLQSTPVSPGSGNDDKAPPAAQPEQPSVVASAPLEATASASRPAEAAPAPAKLAAASPKAPATGTDTRSAAPAASHNASQNGWGVQLGLFAKRENAERLAHNAQARGFAVSVSNADAKGLYRVYASGMADRGAAEAYSQRLKEQGLPAAVVAAP